LVEAVFGWEFGCFGTATAGLWLELSGMLVDSTARLWVELHGNVVGGMLTFFGAGWGSLKGVLDSADGVSLWCDTKGISELEGDWIW